MGKKPQKKSKSSSKAQEVPIVKRKGDKFFSEQSLETASDGKKSSIRIDEIEALITAKWEDDHDEEPTEPRSAQIDAILGDGNTSISIDEVASDDPQMAESHAFHKVEYKIGGSEGIALIDEDIYARTISIDLDISEAEIEALIAKYDIAQETASDGKKFGPRETIPKTKASSKKFLSGISANDITYHHGKKETTSDGKKPSTLAFDDPKNQDIIKKFVDREVYSGISFMVEYILKQEATKNNEPPFTIDDVENLDDPENEGELKEVFEWYHVSEYLAKRLRAKHEVIIESNIWIWGRTTTGQSIFLDWVMGDICSDIEILVGQVHA